MKIRFNIEIDSVCVQLDLDIIGSRFFTHKPIPFFSGPKTIWIIEVSDNWRRWFNGGRCWERRLWQMSVVATKMSANE